MSQKPQSFVFVAKTAPYGSSKPQLCLDAALATAVFEQSVSYVFTGDGVYQLLKDQNAEAIQAKTLGNAMETLDLYGIEQVSPPVLLPSLDSITTSSFCLNLTTSQFGDGSPFSLFGGVGVLESSGAGLPAS